MNNKQKEDLMKQLLKEIDTYSISIIKLHKGCNVSYRTAERFIEERIMPHTATLIKYDEFIEKNFRAHKRKIQRDDIVKVNDQYFTYAEFTSALLKNIDKLRTLPEFRMYEANLKQSGVIEYLEEIKDSPKSFLNQA